MTLDDVKEHFVTWRNAMRKSGFSENAYCNWMVKGFIPYHAQIKLSEASGGVLKADGINKYIKSNRK